MSKEAYVVFNIDRRDRLAEFIHRMEAAPPCSSKADAFDQLSMTLIAVENEVSGIPFDPNFPLDDGRMYPPRADASRTVPGRADLERFRSAKHNTYFSEDEAILIVDLEKRVILDKADSQARRVIL